MNESELKNRWEKEKPIYNAWGSYIVEKIKIELAKKGKNINYFLKVPATYRLKDENSLIDKAFYRPNKEYTDPYFQIEDKVGARFIVLLLDDIQELCKIIEDNPDWTFDACKHFDQDRQKDPLLFTYQSVHYILRPKSTIDAQGINIPVDTPCEVQIRTLLQHAHAEITHDAIYKSKKVVQPKIQRTVAKSMALIETTDDFFSQVANQLNKGPLQEHCILERLNNIYYSFTKLHPHNQKSSLTIWDEFEQFIDENLIEKINVLIKNKPFLSELIVSNYSQNTFYQQSTVLFIYWLLTTHKKRLLNDWPFPIVLLEPLATDIGVSIHDQ